MSTGKELLKKMIEAEDRRTAEAYCYEIVEMLDERYNIKMSMEGAMDLALEAVEDASEMKEVDVDFDYNPMSGNFNARPRRTSFDDLMAGAIETVCDDHVRAAEAKIESDR